MASSTRPDAEQKSNCTKDGVRIIINDGAEVSTRKSQARFQIIQVSSSAESRMRHENLKTCLGFPCLGLNPIKDSITLSYSILKQGSEEL